jgi:5-methylcytosine-specific restriction endonuclease McrA
LRSPIERDAELAVVRERSRRYRQEHLEELREKDRARARLPDRRERHRQWASENPDRLRELDRERKARLKALPERHTAEDIERLRQSQGNQCHWCHRAMTENGSLKATTDHVIPISRGGSDSVSNLVQSCFPCNMAKHAELPEEFLRRRDRPGMAQANDVPVASLLPAPARPAAPMAETANGAQLSA